MRNFPCLTFQIFCIRIDAQKWMMDEWVSSGNIFSKLNLTKFDKIKFQKSWHQTLMLTKSWWERPINSWRTRYFSFFLTSKDAWQSFCLIETWKFLGFTQDSIAREIISPPLSISCTKPQASLLLKVQWGDAFWQDRNLTWGFSLFTGNMSVPVCPSTTPQTPL